MTSAAKHGSACKNEEIAAYLDGEMVAAAVANAGVEEFRFPVLKYAVAEG